MTKTTQPMLAISAGHTTLYFRVSDVLIQAFADAIIEGKSVYKLEYRDTSTGNYDQACFAEPLKMGIEHHPVIEMTRDAYQAQPPTADDLAIELEAALKDKADLAEQLKAAHIINDTLQENRPDAVNVPVDDQPF